METRFVKAYIDEVSFSNLTSEDREMLKKYGYTEDEQGEVAVSFKFGDGIAFVPNHCGLVLRYPTLVEVAQSEKMQQEIAAYTNRPDIIPYDIALKYGKLGEYKMVADYPAWVQQGDNKNKDIFSLHLKDHHVFDVFEDEFCALDDKGYLSSNEGYYELREDLSADALHRLQAKYGILWTEWIGNHVFDERGYLKDAA